MAVRIGWVFAVTFILISGCVGAPANTATTTEPREHSGSITHADNLTNESVTNHAIQKEKKRIISEANKHSIQKSNISCDAQVDYRNDSASIVDVQCLGGIYFENDEHEDVASRSFYFYNSSTVRLSSPSDASSKTHPSNGNQGETTSGFQVVNLGTDPHTVSVTVRNSSKNTLLGETYELQTNESVIQNGLALSEGETYEVIVERNSQKVTKLVHICDEDARYGHQIVIYVLPDDTVITDSPSCNQT